ncbi:MAG: multicopper oxidase domain-containing protein [Balneolaceae bacterium]|nr:multicopper oxidase domain-containing protein [Balneolaceae bacterium]
MNTFKQITLAMAGLFLVLFAVPTLAQDSTGTEPFPAEFEIDGKWYGLPDARLYQEDYDGPPVVGDNLTMLPNVAPLSPGNKNHDVRIDVVTQEIEVAPDMRYRAWTFGGTVPGPVLHVREGDKITFTMKNRSHEEVAISQPAKGGSMFMQQLASGNMQNPQPAVQPMMHSMDFHSGTVAADDKWRNVPPGMTLQFEWIANYPGVYIYHCGTPPVLQHMSMGQYGVVIVSPKEGYPTDEQVDKEFAVVQSEFYLKEKVGEEGIYELDYNAALNKQPTVVAFNGHQNAMMENPLQVDKGDRVRLYMLNVGPNDVASSHVIGAIFDRVWYEGNLENEWRGMQTVLLGASNGAVMEFIVPEEGHYVLVDHEMADAEKGAKGLIVTGGDSN